MTQAAATVEARDQVADLERRVRELERSNAELEQFAYVASHDLQEPLRVIRSCLDLFIKQYADRIDEGGMLFLDHAVDGSDRMRVLLDDLLSYARVGRGDRPAEPVDLTTLVCAAVETIDDGAGEAPVIQVGTLPTVMGDPVELGQLIRNLLSNACKFKAPGQRPHVGIDATPSPEGWHVIVVDDGIGIPAEHREGVFEMFRRLHGRSQYPGTGMGLALCRRVVERHGGRIWADDSPTGGTALHVLLPGACA